MNSFRETYFKFKLLGKRIYKHSSLTRPHQVIVKKNYVLTTFPTDSNLLSHRRHTNDNKKASKGCMDIDKLVIIG